MRLARRSWGRRLGSPMSYGDAARLHMDAATNPMTIAALLVVDEPLSLGTLQKLVRERLLLHERFRCRVTEPLLPLWAPRWEPDPGFSLGAHVHHVALPSPGNLTALSELMGDLLSLPLDRRIPLWQLHLVERFGRGSAVVVRVHHALADGVALAAVLAGFSDEGAEVGPMALPSTEGGRAALREVPARILEAAAGAGRLLSMRSDPKTCLRGALGARKRVGSAELGSLVRVKGVAARLGAKVNDVLLSVVAGALGEHLRARGDQPDELRALVPVSLRDSRASSLGNQYASVFVPLPLAELDSVARTLELKRRMDVIKATRQASAALGLLGIAGHAAATLEHVAVKILSRNASLMVSNVPGPTSTLHLGGAALRKVVVWAPTPGEIGLGLTLMSYGGEIGVGVASDAGVLPEPALLAAGVAEEMDGLARRVLGGSAIGAPGVRA